MLAGASGGPSPSSSPLQLPYVARRRWLALRVPGRPRRSTATACSTPPTTRGRSTGRRAQCGLLLDEWTEVIPGDERRRPASRSTTTGPTPSRRRRCCSSRPRRADGAWRWDDLVGALDETLDLAGSARSSRRSSTRPPYARFLPATVMAATLRGITIATALARQQPAPLADGWPMAERFEVARHPRRAARAPRSRRSRCGTGSRAGRARSRFDRALQRRGARRAVDAHAPVADRRVPRRRRRLAGLREAARRRTRRSTRYRPGDGPAEPFDDDVPARGEVERRPLPLALGGREVALDLRLVDGPPVAAS